jgi:hypothetical protein
MRSRTILDFRRILYRDSWPELRYCQEEIYQERKIGNLANFGMTGVFTLEPTPTAGHAGTAVFEAKRLQPVS